MLYKRIYEVKCRESLIPYGHAPNFADAHHPHNRMDPQLHDHSLKERTCSCSSLGAGILKKELEKKRKCPNISEDDIRKNCGKP